MLGRLLVPLLVAEGHEALGLTRGNAALKTSSEQEHEPRSATARPRPPHRVASDFGPEAVVHQLRPARPPCVHRRRCECTHQDGGNGQPHRRGPHGRSDPITCSRDRLAPPRAGGAGRGRPRTRSAHDQVQWSGTEGSTAPAPTTRVIPPQSPRIDVEEAVVRTLPRIPRTPASTGSLMKKQDRCALAATRPRVLAPTLHVGMVSR